MRGEYPPVACTCPTHKLSWTGLVPPSAFISERGERARRSHPQKKEGWNDGVQCRAVTVSAEPRFTLAHQAGEIDRLYALQQARRAVVAQTMARQRIAKIRKLHDALLARREEIRAALWEDYRKPAAEVDLSEIFPVLGEARHAMRHLARWMKPRRV